MKYPFGLLAPTKKFPFMPPEEAAPGTAGSDLGRAVLRLEDLVPFGHEPLGAPGDVVEIGSVTSWLQWPVPCPGHGDITLGLDHNRRFVDMAEFAGGREFADPDLLTCIGGLELSPGVTSRLRFTTHGPWQYVIGRDAIIVAPEIFTPSPGYEVDARFAFNVLRAVPLGLAPGVVYAMPTPHEYAGLGYCFRTLIGPVAHGGEAVRVHISAGSLGCDMPKASVGIAAGLGPDMVGPPVPLTWNGAAGPGLGPHGWRYSDAVELPVAPGDRLVLNFWLPNNAWPYRDSGVGKTWYAAADCHARWDMPGAIPHPQPRTPVVDCVEVLP